MSESKSDQALTAVERTLRTKESRERVAIPVTIEEQEKYVKHLLEEDKKKEVLRKEHQRDLERKPERLISFYNPQRHPNKQLILKLKLQEKRLQNHFKRRNRKNEYSFEKIRRYNLI